VIQTHKCSSNSKSGTSEQFWTGTVLAFPPSRCLLLFS